jgi:hypothetical protein
MDVTHKDPQLELAADLRGFFHDVLVEALHERRVEASESTAHYLVALLADFAHPKEETNEALERPLPFLLQEALAAVGRERFERLRMLGDNVLYTSGFFLDHLETRGVQLTYVSALGARAYGSAASMLRVPGQPSSADGAPELFEELADKFTRFAEVLSTVSEGLFANSAITSDTGALRTYERWLRTGSPQLSSALATRGMVATRGRGGVH